MNEYDEEWNKLYKHVSINMLKNSIQIPLADINARHPSTSSLPIFHMEDPNDDQIAEDIHTLSVFKQELRRVRNVVTILEEYTTVHRQMGVIDGTRFIERCSLLEDLRNKVDDVYIALLESKKNMKIAGNEYTNTSTDTYTTMTVTGAALTEDDNTEEEEEEEEDDDHLQSTPRTLMENTPNTLNNGTDWVIVEPAEVTTSETMADETGSLDKNDGILELDSVATKNKRLSGFKWLLSNLIGGSNLYES